MINVIRLTEFEAERGRKATVSQIDRIWNEAARDAGAVSEAADPGDGLRRSTRSFLQPRGYGSAP